MKYDQSWAHDEHLCVTRSSTGLLKGFQLSSSDRTATIIVNAAKTARMATMGIPSSAPPTSGANLFALFKISDPSLTSKLFSDFIGRLPIKRDDYALIYNETLHVGQTPITLSPELNLLLSALYIEYLKHIGAVVTEEAEKLARSPQKKERIKSQMNFRVASLFQNVGVLVSLPSVETDSSMVPSSADEQKDLIFYRTAVRDVGKVTLTLAAKPQEAFDFDVDVVAGKVESIPVKRAVLVHKVTKFAFDDGVLRGMSVNTPSQMLGLSKVPLDVAKAVIEVPASFFTAIGNSFKAETGALSEQINLMAKRQEFLERKQDILEGKTISKSAESGGGSPPSDGSSWSDDSAPAAYSDAAITECTPFSKDNGQPVITSP